jgi:hypothetical protein
VSDNGSAKTYFACTNNGTVPATVGVQLYGADGSPLNTPASSQLTLNPNETRLFATSGAGVFNADSILISPLFNIGSAQILATVSKRISCSAWFASSDKMAGLTVIKKNTQKGR